MCGKWKYIVLSSNKITKSAIGTRITKIIYGKTHVIEQGLINMASGWLAVVLPANRKSGLKTNVNTFLHFSVIQAPLIYMVTSSSNGSISCIIGPLWREFTGHRWIPRTKYQWRGALMFSLICVWKNGWANNRDAGDWRRYHAHYDVTVKIFFNPMAAEVHRGCLYRQVLQYYMWLYRCSDVSTKINKWT